MEEMISILWRWLDETIPYIGRNTAVLPGLWSFIAWPVVAIGLGLLYYLNRR